MQQSGKSVKDYLQEAGVNYSTYNYWRRKLLAKDNPKLGLAPISFPQHADPVFSGIVPSSAILLFPNGFVLNENTIYIFIDGLTAHYGKGYTYSALARMIKVARLYSDREMFATLSQTLTWSHFIELITIKDETKRLFVMSMRFL